MGRLIEVAACRGYCIGCIVGGLNTGIFVNKVHFVRPVYTFPFCL